ncbi:hypothetical protein C5C27_05750 [Rathayibacter sp. AY2B7]|uniref:GNAT family N-acetyltransferase n=1 Tax=Rathayibacter sp. AY2B7 TaxID=2080571 RepID=UPI000CE7E7F7|nr:GNAT family N-acetyltransferase [Rathayibacter sp. AY2B7]PPG63610.1 hypothetical protein C5C27_05750 [Rathayibacter sp. AY2B7]
MSGVVVRLEDAAGAEGLLAAVPPPHARVLIARIDGAAAGALVLAPGPDDFAEVLELVVASVHRRTGVARRLVAAAESWARVQRIRTLRLAAAAELAPAAGALGFTAIDAFGAHVGDNAVLCFARPV